MPVKAPTVTLYTPAGGVATLPSNVLDGMDMRLVAEYLAYLEREQLRPEWFCQDCKTYGEVDTNRDSQDRVVEVLFRCTCRTIYGTLQSPPSPVAPSATPT